MLTAFVEAQRFDHAVTVCDRLVSIVLGRISVRDERLKRSFLSLTIKGSWPHLVSCWDKTVRMKLIPRGLHGGFLFGNTLACEVLCKAHTGDATCDETGQ